MDGTAAARLIDWGAAARVGARLAGVGPLLTDGDRSRLADDFSAAVSEADSLVTGLTGLRIDGPPTRPWVMTRAEWISRNLRGFEGVLEPFAQRVLARRSDGPGALLRRKALGWQLGALLGYLGRKVLGQYDLFLPPDDRDLLYFVGPNVVTVERKLRFPRRDFRRWLAMHEVTHRVQFSAVPWLRGYVEGLVDAYLDSVDLDARKLAERLRKAREEARQAGQWRSLGVLFALMSPEQRDVFGKVQAVMTLLEGHANHAMESLSRGRIRSAARMRLALRRRRRGRGLERMFQRAVGFDVKTRQYDVGERFVARAVDRAGMTGFNRVWEQPEHLPTIEEVREPDAWVARMAAA